MPFNTGQQALIDAPLDQKVVGVAGAGTGKTTTILGRTKRILKEFDTGKILMITFTRMAAQDMQARLYRQINDNDRRRITVGTFHSVISQLLRDHAVEVGLDPSFSIIDEGSAIVMYQSILNQHQDWFDKYEEAILGPKGQYYNSRHTKLLKRDYNKFATSISTMINSAQPDELMSGRFSDNTKDRLVKLVGLSPQLLEVTLPIYYQVFKDSLRVSRETNTINYDHILFLGYLMLKSGMLNSYADSLVHMIVDEYQDTNALQDAFVRGVGQNHLTLVGDVDQAIYEFRGGDANLLVQHAKEGQVVNLTVNYRSYQPILDAANEVINHNQSGQSIRKPLVANKQLDDKYGGMLRVNAKKDYREAENIIKWIKFKIRQGTPANDIAILVRSRMAMSALNQVFQTEKIAVNDTTQFADFMKSEVMKDTLNFIKIFTNPKDIYAFMAVLDRPKRNIGAKSIELLQHNAATHAMSVVEYLMSEYIETELSPGLKKNVKSFIEVYDELIKPEHQHMAFPEMVEFLLTHTGYKAWAHKLKNHKTHDKNFTILSGMVDEFNEKYKQDHKDFTLFDIANAFTFEMTSSIKQEDKQGVTIATIHGAKGLEWSHVFVVGMENECFPGNKVEDEADLEAERRLMYVAITRAKDSLWLDYSKHRISFGNQELEPSVFLDEIDDIPERDI